MWLITLGLLITLYHYKYYENKAFSGITVQVITTYTELTAPSYTTYPIDTASTYWKTFQPATELSLPNVADLTHTLN